MTNEFTREYLDQLLGKESGAMADAFLNGEPETTTLPVSVEQLARYLHSRFTPGRDWDAAGEAVIEFYADEAMNLIQFWMSGGATPEDARTHDTGTHPR